MRSDPSSVAVLLNRGADINVRDTQGQTVLHYAARAGADTVNALALQGADLNAPDNLGARPLHVAAAMKHQGAAEALLRSGAQADAQDRFGVTPLRDAQRRGAVEIASLLRAASDEPVAASLRQPPRPRPRATNGQSSIR
jgi:serine/threonine-protein phosphatase 6 regulatory ankyrin repeat subunit B